MYSDIGLGFGDGAGVDRLYFHYNRRTQSLGQPFLQVDAAATSQSHNPFSVQQSTENGRVEHAFYARNAWLTACSGIDSLVVRPTAGGQEPEAASVRLLQLPRQSRDDHAAVSGLLPTLDPRDPDRLFPYVVALRAVHGSIAEHAEDGSLVRIAADSNGRITVAIVAAALDFSLDGMLTLLEGAPDSGEQARRATRRWFETSLGNLEFSSDKPEESAVAAKAAFSLIYNSTLAPGNLAGRVSSFPNRGGYPTHFLWDSCFHNLALEDMEPRLAEDALLLLTDTMRPDGKMAHFLCSTWMRPHASQPPLVGWAAVRLVTKRRSAELAGRLAPPLARNCQWWLRQRMSSRGVLYCDDPLETGWDDTPRLDQGAILPCDMNSYLLLQMRAVAQLYGLAGNSAAAGLWEAEADSFAANIVRELYDEKDNIFRDVLVESGRPLSILTPACFLPLLAGVPLSEEKTRTMIERYLLDENRFFGDVPFPSVAYDEPTYEPGKWWRGPTWLPVAWFMLEILAEYGYTDEHRQAAERLYRTAVADGKISELFNSSTGEGMGNRQQGWTAAIILKLNKLLRE
jgi:hypothetical protein